MLPDADGGLPRSQQAKGFPSACFKHGAFKWCLRCPFSSLKLFDSSSRVKLETQTKKNEDGGGKLGTKQAGCGLQ